MLQSDTHAKDMEQYTSCLEALRENSADAKIFCLMHKMDLIPEDQRDGVFTERVAEVDAVSKPMDVRCYRTSIWDETLYRAWSSIVYSLVPNVSVLEAHLENVRANVT